MFSTNLTELNETNFEFIKRENGYVKKYANGYFEAFAKATVYNDFGFIQIGESPIYYSPFSNVAIGISAIDVKSIQVNANNNGVIWAGNAKLNTNKAAVDGMVFQYGSDKLRYTYLTVEVKGMWK